MMYSILPPGIAELAVCAPALPEGATGWTAESVRRALEALRMGKVAIVDIEVYDRVVWGFAPAGESWTCHRTAGESASAFALRSRREARAWIDVFPREQVLFVVEFSGQDAANEASRA